MFFKKEIRLVLGIVIVILVIAIVIAIPISTKAKAMVADKEMGGERETAISILGYFNLNGFRTKTCNGLGNVSPKTSLNIFLYGKEGSAKLVYSDKVLWQGEKPMDSPETLQWFIHFGTRKFPAKRYILIIWGHGNREKIAGMPIKDFLKGLKKGLDGRTLDILFVASCLGSTKELMEGCAKNHIARVVIAAQNKIWTTDAILINSLLRNIQEKKTDKIIKSLFRSFRKSHDSLLKIFSILKILNPEFSFDTEVKVAAFAPNSKYFQRLNLYLLSLKEDKGFIQYLSIISPFLKTGEEYYDLEKIILAGFLFTGQYSPNFLPETIRIAGKGGISIRW